MQKNNFIVIEGVDGAGKSTITKMLSGFLEGNCALFVEPTTNSPYTQPIRAILSGNHEGGEDDLLNLFKKDRIWNIENNILPSLQKNKVTILDRYYFSTAAYQGHDREGVRTIMNDYLDNDEILQPDFVFYLRIDAETAMQRITSRKGSLDIFEKKSRLEKIIENYDYIFSGFDLPFSCFMLDARAASGEILDFIVQKVFPVE